MTTLPCGLPEGRLDVNLVSSIPWGALEAPDHAFFVQPLEPLAQAWAHLGPQFGSSGWGIWPSGEAP